MDKRLRLLLPTFILLLVLASSFAYNSSGGIISYVENYTVVAFLTNGTFNITGTIPNAEILIVAGGGGGGGGGIGAGGSGAGGGGLLNGTLSLAGGSYSVVVGAGGAGGAANSYGRQGENSSFYGAIAIGGGAGREVNQVVTSLSDGGSSGGGSGAGGGGNPGTKLQGDSGGLTGYAGTGGQGDCCNALNYTGGGGGGAGGDASGSIKGAGKVCTINGTAITYAEGGYGNGRLTPFINASVPGLANRGYGGNGGNRTNVDGGAGGSGIIIIRYLNDTPEIGNIKRISQTPANLTTADESGLRTEYNITNITSGTPYFIYTINNSLSNISLFINKTGYAGYKNKTGTYISTIFNFTLDHSEALPGTYAINYSLFYNRTHVNISLNHNSYLSTELFNVSNKTPYNFYEFMANGTGTSSIASYYCNSSYAFTSAPPNNTNCALIGNVPNNQPYNHTHSTNSSHHLLPFSINTTTGTFGSTTVRITPQSFFIINGAETNTNVSTVPLRAQINTTRLSTDNGNSYTVNNSSSVDMHIHQFTSDETIYYKVHAVVGGAQNNSSIFSQAYGFSNLPPTTPRLLTPITGINYGTINISWLASLNLTPGTLYYNISLLNADFSFNKTIIANTTELYYSWNSAGTEQANYTIKVMAIDNYSLSSYDIGNQFTLATFNATLITPTEGSILAGYQPIMQYSTNNIKVNANCTIYLDTVAINTQDTFNATYQYIPTTSAGTHTWYVSCVSNDTLFTYTTATKSFSMQYESFLNTINLTTSPENIFSEPQLLFYDINGSLNVLYYVDNITNSIIKIQTINGTTITRNYTLALSKNNYVFAMALREVNKTVIYAINQSDSTKALILNINDNGVLNYTIAAFPYSIVNRSNSYYDAYTYSNTAHYQTLNLTANSQYFFMVPVANGSAYFTLNATSNTLTQIGAQLPANVASVWQTIANDSELKTWYYLTTNGTNISLGYFNGTALRSLYMIGNNYTAAQLNGSIGNFYEYGGKKYVMVSNLTNTIIHSITNNITYTLNKTLTAPSFMFFVDSNTFLFYNIVGATTDAYSCYFTTTANCTNFVADEYGFSMPYARGRLTTMKRDGTSDVVAQGSIISGDTVRLQYNQYTYDGKYVCYDEMAETRKTFVVGVYTDTSSNVLTNNSWGYVIPSSILGNGTKKAYFTCANGTQRLFIAGLNANYTINSYSLEIPKGLYYTFQALNQYNIPIPNATMTAYRFSNDNQAFVVIQQGITDFNGNAVFYLEPYQFYKFVVSSNGYVVLTFDLTPGATTTLGFKLSQTSGTVLSVASFEQVFNDVSYLLAPNSTYHNQSFNITYTISSAEAGLEYYGMLITRNHNGTTTTVFNTNTTGASGGILQYTATLNGTYYVDIWFKHQNYTLFQPRTFTYFLSPTQGLGEIKARLPRMFGGWAYFLIATIVSLLVAGYISRYTIDGAGIIGLLCLWFFTLMNPGAVIFGGISIMMATILTSIIVVAGLLWKQFG